MARAAKPKKEISMEEALWKSADKLRGSCLLYTSPSPRDA